MLKKALSTLLAVAMVITMLPMNVFATSEEPVAEPAAVVETVPSEPAPETPAEPADETPIEPVEPAEPAEPAGETPIGETPVEPAGDEPKAEEPVEEAPVGETPIEPAGETPVGETPIEPEDDTPKAEEPADETPVEESVAFSATEVVGGTKIEINAAAGVFPNGTTVKITEVTAAVEGAIESAVDGEVTAMRAFDISFFNAEGVEIQPNGDVNVRFTLSVADAPAVAAADTTEVFHMADAAAAPEKVAETAATNNIAVDVDEFSIYTVTVSRKSKSDSKRNIYVKSVCEGVEFDVASFTIDLNSNSFGDFNLQLLSSINNSRLVGYKFINATSGNYTIYGLRIDKELKAQYKENGKWHSLSNSKQNPITLNYEKNYVAFDANGGDVDAPSNVAIGNDGKITIPSYSGKIDDREFLGWSRTENGDVDYKAGVKAQISAGTVLYAVFEEIKVPQSTEVTAEYWITNKRVTANGQNSKQITVTNEETSINSIAPENGTAESGNVVFWQARVLPSNATQTLADIDQSTKGVQISAFKLDDDGQVCYRLSGTDRWVKYSNGEQIVFYYQQAIVEDANWTIDYVKLFISDWPGGSNGSYASTQDKVIYQVFVDGVKEDDLVTYYYNQNNIVLVDQISVVVKDPSNYSFDRIEVLSDWDNGSTVSGTSVINLKSGKSTNGNSQVYVNIYLTTTIQTYTVTYAPGEHGKWIAEVHTGYEANSTTPRFTGNTANCDEGYEFTGWSPTFENKVTGSIVYTAQWKQSQRYSVTYDGNGNTAGSAPADTNRYLKNSEVTVKAAGTLEKTGYTFVGWNTQADGKGTDYENEDTFNITANTTLYAKWTQNTYTVTYYDEDGTTELDTVTGALGSDGNYDGVVNPPVKAQTAQYTYAFSGWEYVSGTALKEGKIAGHAAYKASYTPTLRTYTVTIGVAPAGYGTVSETTIEKVPYGAAISVTDNVLTVGDNKVTATAAANTAQYTYSFANWTGVDMTAGAKVEGDVNVTANFKADVNKYTVKFVDGDKLISEGTFDYGTEIVNPTAPTKETTEDDKHVFHVFDFDGWTVKEGTFEAAEEKKLVNGDVTFEASFKETRKVYAGFYVAVVNPTQFATQAELDAWQRAYGTSRPSVNNFFTVRKCNDKNQVVEITLPDLTPEIIPSTYETWVFVNGNGITPFLGSNLSTINAEAVAKADSLNIAHDNNDVTWYAIKRENDGWHVDGFMKATWAHTVNFYMNVEANETAINTQTVIHNKTAKTFADPTRTGYTFGGWYSNANCTGDAFSFKTAILSDRNLYAKWTANNYQVIFNGNGATNTFPTVPTSSVNATYSQTFTYDETKALSANLFEKVGHTFAGWNTATDGSGVRYTDKQSVKNLVAQNGGTITLYAQWTVNKYTLSYNNNLSGADALTEDGGSYDYDTNATVVDNMFTAPDHKYFTGWNTSANGIGGTSYAASNEIKITENTVLYAQWGEKNDVKISISGEKIEKPYDGTEYTAGYEVTGIPANSGITVELKNGLTGSVARTDVGTTPLTLTEDMFTVSAGSEYNVTVEVNNGYVKINPLTVSFRTEGASKTYDGAVLKNEVGEIFGLLNGETAHLNYTGAQVNAGSSDNTAEIVFDTAKADNYFIDTQAVSLGKLEVSPVAIEITADSANKVWDGAPLTAHGYKITDGAFIGTDGFDTVTVTGSQLPVGDSPNRITNYTFKAGTISINYDVTTVAGTLTVYERPYIYPPVTPPTTPTTIITPPVIPLAPTDGYTITFVDYDGTVIRTGSFDLGDTVSFPAGPSRENYDFSEWTLATGTELGIGNTVQGDATYMANYMSTAERTINDPSIPLANGGEGWALLNLILTVITALTSALMIVGYFTKKKNGKKEAAKSKTAARFGTLVPALGAIITFFLTENMNSKMIFSDKYTLLMAAIALVGIAVSAFAISEKKNKAKAK